MPKVQNKVELCGVLTDVGHVQIGTDSQFWSAVFQTQTVEGNNLSPEIEVMFQAVHLHKLDMNQLEGLVANVYGKLVNIKGQLKILATRIERAEDLHPVVEQVQETFKVV